MFGQDYLSPSEAAELQSQLDNMKRRADHLAAENANLRRDNANMLHTLRQMLAARRAGIADEINWAAVERMTKT